VSSSVVHERKLIGVKIFNQIVDVSLDCGGASDVSDMSGVKPMRQASKLLRVRASDANYTKIILS